MSDFVIWAQRLATHEYLQLFYENYMRINVYGRRKTKIDRDFFHIIKSIPKNVSSIPYESRNSVEYFQECPNETVLLGDFGICEKAAMEYIECAELCSTPEYYMTFCQRKNGCTNVDEQFDLIQKRAFSAGVSIIPYDTKRSNEYCKNISFLLAPISKYC